MRRSLSITAVAIVVGWLGLAGAGASAQQSRGASIAAFENVSIPAAEKSDLGKLTDAGVVTTDGAAAIVVNLVGEMRGRAEKEGAIGVLLLPDVAPIDSAFRTRRALLVSQEVAVHVADGESSYFMARQQRFEVGFPRYRVLLYNSTGTGATASVFVNRIR